MNKYKIAIFGCGSLGANTALTLSRRFPENIDFLLIDHDRIGLENLANQPWFDYNIGQTKATVLGAFLWRLSKVSSTTFLHRVEATGDFHGKLSDFSLLVDCFDNAPSRMIVQNCSNRYNIPVVHGGFSLSTFLVDWGENFPIISRNSDPICDRRDLVTIVNIGSTMLAEAAFHFLSKKTKLRSFGEFHEGIPRIHTSEVREEI